MLYFLFGAFGTLGGITGLVLIPLWLTEWLGDDRPIGLLRIGMLSVTLVGSACGIALGLACIATGAHVISARRSSPHMRDRDERVGSN
jgi:hypothetical protein